MNHAADNTMRYSLRRDYLLSRSDTSWWNSDYVTRLFAKAPTNGLRWNRARTRAAQSRGPAQVRRISALIGEPNWNRTEHGVAPTIATQRERAGRVKGAQAASLNLASEPLTRPSAPAKW